MSDDLRERVARVLRAFYSDEPIAVCDGVAYKAADAAIALVRAEVIEEAARVVRRMPSPSSDWIADELLRALGGYANPVPSAIRALKDAP